jgi:hypothetical protein
LRSDEAIGQHVKASFIASDRTYGARRVWRDLLAEGVDCGMDLFSRRVVGGRLGKGMTAQLAGEALVVTVVP